MSLHETEALVLRNYPLGEADKIVVFLTRSHGLVRGVAKGAKRLSSRFGGSLEPFSTVKLEFFQPGDRELVAIKRCEIVRSVFDRASDPALLTELSYFSEILLRFSPPALTDDRLYRMMRKLLGTASDHPEAAARLAVYFNYWILQLGGFMPSWTSCSHCGRSLSDDEPSVVRADFRLACGNCEPVRQQNSISGGVRAAAAAARRFGPDEFLEFAEERETEVLVLDGYLRRMIGTVLGREAGTA